MTRFEEIERKHLEKAQVKLHTTTDRLVKFDALQTIISRCRSLRMDPLPWLKDPRENDSKEVKQPKNDSIMQCPHCDFKTDKGIQSLRAHIGMRHKKLNS